MGARAGRSKDKLRNIPPKARLADSTAGARPAVDGNARYEKLRQSQIGCDASDYA